jgi:hypothetical protein
MRILRTGEKGYNGAVMVPLLILEGQAVTELKTGLRNRRFLSCRATLSTVR